MSVISGRYAEVDFDNAETYVRAWTVSYDAEFYDGTNFDESTGGRTRVAGIPSWSGSYEAYFSTGNTATPGTSGAAIFRTTTGESGVVFGGILLTNMTINAPVDGVVTQNFTFEGINVPAFSTA